MPFKRRDRTWSDSAAPSRPAGHRLDPEDRAIGLGAAGGT